MIKLLGELAAIPPWAILLVGFGLPALEASSWLGLVVPGSLAVLLGGALAQEGRVSLAAVMAAAVSGAVLGDSVGYALGVRYGSVLFHSDRARRHMRRAQAFVHRHGGVAILLGHWAAFLGTVVPSIAGASGIPYRRFLPRNLISGLTWGIGLAGIGYLARGAYRRVEEAVGLTGVAATVVLLIVLAGTLQLRRRIASRPRRKRSRCIGKRPGSPAYSTRIEAGHERKTGAPTIGRKEHRMHRPMKEADDDSLIHYPRVGRPRAWLSDAVDRLVGADPGLNQLRMALVGTLGVAVALGLAYLFVKQTGAMQPPAGGASAPALAAADHTMFVVSLLFAAIVAMISGLAVQDHTAHGQVLSTLLLPVTMVTGLVLGMLVGPYHVLSLAFLVVVMAVAVYARRFPPRGFSAGLGLFLGAFLGYFLHARLALGNIGWIAAEIGIGALASLLARFAIARMSPERALARISRSQRARARRLLELSAGVLINTDQRRIHALQERIRRQLVRLNETTLMRDAQLAETHPDTAALEAHRQFDAELALENCARFAGALATKHSPPVIRRRAADALSALLDGGPAHVSRALAALRKAESEGHHTAVLVSRLATAVEHYARAGLNRPVGEDENPGDIRDDFSPAVGLVNNWLPGSMPISTEASATRGRGLLNRATMPHYVRTMVQITIAGALAVVAGDALSGTRLYWAVLATFFAFMNATNSGEQLRRALFRVGGTAVGIVVGDLLVHLTGANVWASLVIVLVGLFLGLYLIRLNYMFMVIAITVILSQLYEQLEEFSWQLLVLRLAETAIGASAVIVTVMFIVPLRPQRVLTTAVLGWFTALRQLLDAALGRFDGQREPLRPLVRAVDAAYAALMATATPLRTVTFGRNSTQLTQVLAVSSAARQYARSLADVIDRAEADGERLSWADNRQVRAAVEQLRASAQAIEHRIATGEDGRYVRSAALVALVLDDLRLRHSPLADALIDISLLDGTLARLAAALRMRIDDHDTGHRADKALRVGGQPPS